MVVVDNIKKYLFAIIFFFCYLTLDGPRDCLKALKNKCPIAICNTFFLLCMKHSSDTKSLKPSYLQEVKLRNWKTKFIAKKISLLFSLDLARFWFWQQNITHHIVITKNHKSSQNHS